MNPHVALDVVTSGLEEISHLELGFGGIHFRFHLTVGVIDDGKEHVLDKI